MCGIVGLYLREQKVLREQLCAMNRTIEYRGPDDEGIFLDNQMGMGMRRLSIIDLEGGHQPIFNENGKICVVQNGEIYNFRELRAQLEGRGHHFRSDSDTEVIVHAYEEWGGLEFAQRLRGMFAIAVWDSSNHELWLVRDRIGIKPLYYAVTQDGFAFGSEVKCLLATPIVQRKLEPAVIMQYLSFGHAGISGSFIRNVQQLRPGFVLRYNGRDTVDRKYWDIQAIHARNSMDANEAAEILRTRLFETVRGHMLADVPLGAFLSGGVDSSAIVGTMVNEGCTNLKTFSIGFEQEDFNELPAAAEVAKRWGTEHFVEVVQPEKALSILDRLVDHLDEPFADASAIPTWYVSQLASREVKVVLTGDGGDELFAGYSRYAQIFRDAWLDRIPLGARRCGAQISKVLPHSFPAKYFSDYAARDLRSRFVYNLTLFPGALRKDLLRREWHPETLGFNDPVDDAIASMKRWEGDHPLQECVSLDLVQYLPCDILYKVDRMTMAHSLEARPPLLDHEFVEFVAALPMALKYSGNGSQKYLFKRAIEPVVDKAVLGRRKSGFSVPLQQWFAKPLADQFRDAVLTNSYCAEYLNVDVIRMLFEENQRGRRDHGLRLWAIFMFELWLRRVISAPSCYGGMIAN